MQRCVEAGILPWMVYGVVLKNLLPHLCRPSCVLGGTIESIVLHIKHLLRIIEIKKNRN